MRKRTYIYGTFERFWHWNQAILIFFLALTGFEIHGSYHLFNFENSIIWHKIAAWIFLILIVFAVFWHFVTGQWKNYIPSTKNLKAQFNYYISGIFRGAPHPTHKTVYNKFNPIQRFVYLGLKLLVIPVQVLSGFLYLNYAYPENPIQIESLKTVAVIHTFGGFALLAFIIAHVYLITTSGETPITSLKAMITGWELLDQDDHSSNLSPDEKVEENQIN